MKLYLGPLRFGPWEGLVEDKGPFRTIWGLLKIGVPLLEVPLRGFYSIPGFRV